MYDLKEEDFTEESFTEFLEKRLRGIRIKVGGGVRPHFEIILLFHSYHEMQRIWFNCGYQFIDKDGNPLEQDSFQRSIGRTDNMAVSNFESYTIRFKGNDGYYKYIDVPNIRIAMPDLIKVTGLKIFRWKDHNDYWEFEFKYPGFAWIRKIIHIVDTITG